MADVESLSAEYRSYRSKYAAFTDRLATLVQVILETEQIDVLAIEPRTKTQESFDKKVRREEKAGKYSRSSDVTDLSGIRIIAYLQEDCANICSLISDNFDVDRANSVIKEDELAPDQVGYLSTHYVVQLSTSRIGLPEFRQFQGMKAEIQVRTILQHSWASIDWKFRYKSDQEAPKPLRRRLFRISALLEAADNEFSSVKYELDKLRKEYSDSITSGDLRVGLNTESINTFIEESSTARVLFEAAGRAGVQLSPPETQAVYSALIKVCEEIGISSLYDLDSVLREFIPEAERFFTFAVNYEQLEDDGDQEDGEFALNYPAVLLYSILSRRTMEEIEGNHIFRPLSPLFEEIISDYIQKYRS